MDNASVVLLYSGGLDSSAALYYLRHHGRRVTKLFVDYGQRHRTCEESAALDVLVDFQGGWDGYFKVQLDLTELALPNALTSDVPLPNAGLAPVQTVVPGRNMLLLSLAAILAARVGADSIAIGCNADDAEHYPDCRSLFLVSASAAVGYPIHAPWLDYTKIGVAGAAAELGVPIEKTWSCYAGGPAQCGRCDACVRRADALEAIDRAPFGARLGGDDAAS